jgi:hypothetical protein
MSRPKSPPSPKLTHAPWAGYTAHEHRREAALARCPSARCARVKECVAAHEGLYCQRTHISHAEYISANPPAPNTHPNTHWDNLELRHAFMIERIEQRRAAQAAMTARWKAGEFDQLYGKYSVRGLVLQPPAQIYQEDKRSQFDQT